MIHYDDIRKRSNRFLIDVLLYLMIDSFGFAPGNMPGKHKQKREAEGKPHRTRPRASPATAV